MASLDDGVVRFGQFEFDLLRRELRTLHGRPVLLTSKALDVLAMLITRHGETVDRRTLVRSVWPGRVIEDNNLTQAIAALRRVFGTHGGEHDYVVTVPGNGYRFVMPLWSARSGARFALAVLPFELVSDPLLDPSLGRALADALIVALAPRVPMPVRSLSAVDALPCGLDAAAAGRRLSATHVVEGSIRRRDEGLRVGLRLVDAPTGITPWSCVIDTTREGVWHVHDRLAARIAVCMRRRASTALERRGQEAPRSRA
jgi:DNA-binding winged helix-turn-helix (wHTH) protein/TolB-like protein